MAIALLFVAYSAWDLAHRWQKTKVTLDLPWALASILPLGLGCLIQGRGWIALIERMTFHRVPRGAALSLYMDSQLARYTPGMVGLPFVRMAGAARLGVSAVSVGSSVGLEMLSWTAVGGGVPTRVMREPRMTATSATTATPAPMTARVMRRLEPRPGRGAC